MILNEFEIKVLNNRFKTTFELVYINPNLWILRDNKSMLEFYPTIVDSLKDLIDIIDKQLNEYYS